MQDAACTSVAGGVGSAVHGARSKGVPRQSAGLAGVPTVRSKAPARRRRLRPSPTSSTAQRRDTRMDEGLWSLEGGMAGGSPHQPQWVYPVSLPSSFVVKGSCPKMPAFLASKHFLAASKVEPSFCPSCQRSCLPKRNIAQLVLSFKGTVSLTVGFK